MLRLRQIVARSFTESRPYGGNPLLADYIRDLTSLYGVSPSPGFLDTAVRTSYAEMAAELAVTVDAGHVDLVVTATAAPDADLLQSPSSVLVELLPGDPLPFGVTDQGAVASFTALRLVEHYPGDSAVLVFMDQSALPYETPEGAVEAVTGNQAVALVIGVEDGEALETRTWTGIDPSGAWDVLAELLTEEVVLIAGHGLASVCGAAAAAEILLVPEGTPCTGVWALLAEGLPRWREEDRSVLLADYDAELGYLACCMVHVQPPAPPYEKIRETARRQGPAAAYDLLLGLGDVHGPAGHAWVAADGRVGLASIDVPGGSYVAVGGRPGRPAPAEWQHGLVMLRLGLNDALLDTCLAHLGDRTTGGAPILAQQMVKGQLAEIAIERLLIQNRQDHDAHERITSVDRALLRLLGGMGFRADGPGQVAHFSELLADAYAGNPT